MLGDSTYINNFTWNPELLKKKLLKPLKITIFPAKLVQTRDHCGPHPNQKTIFFVEITKSYYKLSKKIILSKYHMFWLSYECFFIVWCDAKGSFQAITAVKRTSAVNSSNLGL